MADSDPTLRLVKSLQPGEELSPAARSSETRKNTTNPPKQIAVDDADIFASGSAFLNSNAGPESLTRMPKLIKQYRMIRPLGRGGMSRVYLAEHTHMKRRVAIKLLPHNLASDPVMQERFRREARIAAAVNHPNIVQAHDIGECDGCLYFVMEYLEGHDLDRLIREHGRMNPDVVVSYALMAANGLQHAHERKLIHRDVKPANLMIDQHGVLKILDLGLARYAGDYDDQLTARIDKGAVVCTPEFAPPEQIITPEQVDHRADIFSLGVTLYALLSGRSPLEGSLTRKVKINWEHTTKPIHEVLPSVPRKLSLVIDKMMQPRRSDRQQSMGEVIQQLLSRNQVSVTIPTPVPVVTISAPTTESPASAVHKTPLLIPLSIEACWLRNLPNWRRELILTGLAFVLGLTAFLVWSAVDRAKQYQANDSFNPVGQNLLDNH